MLADRSWGQQVAVLRTEQAQAGLSLLGKETALGAEWERPLGSPTDATCLSTRPADSRKV